MPHSIAAAREQARDRASGRRAADPQPDQQILLVGKLYDDKGNRMAASYTRKGAKRWRYYVSRALMVGDAKLAGSCPRLSAPEIENEVVSAVQRHFVSHAPSRGDLSPKLRSSDGNNRR